MKITVQLVVCDDDGHEETFTDVVVLENACQRVEHLGLTRAEAMQTLTALQQCLVEQQPGAFVAAHSQCDHCGKALGIHLNQELGPLFRRWYPDLQREEAPLAA